MTGTPRYLYVPWIGAHGDWLVDRIAATTAIDFEILRLFPAGDNAARRDLLSLAALRPDAFARSVAARMHAVPRPVNGAVFTHDWSALMRTMVRAVQSARLPTVLVPHESVFLSRGAYYRDARGPITAPLCDRALVWGGLQRDIFVERGMDPAHIEIVGSPKLDAAAHHSARVDAATVRTALGMTPLRPFALFALQLLDNAADPAAARHAQIEAVRTVASAVSAQGTTLVVRIPPAGLREELGLSALSGTDCVIDHGDGPGPLDVAAHAALVVSVGSTLLIEAYLMGRPTLQIDLDPAASGAELSLSPSRAQQASAAAALTAMLLRRPFAPDPAFRAFLDAAFSAGKVGDGRSAERIVAALHRLAAPARRLASSGVDSTHDPLSLFQRLRRYGMPRRLAARLI